MLKKYLQELLVLYVDWIRLLTLKNLVSTSNIAHHLCLHFYPSNVSKETPQINIYVNVFFWGLLVKKSIFKYVKTIYLNYVCCYLQRNYGTNYIASLRTSVYMVKVVNTAKLVEVSFSEAERHFKIKSKNIEKDQIF